MLSGFRSRTWVQSGLSSSYSSVFPAWPLRSTVVTRFSATMGLSDSRPGPPLGYVFPRAVGVGCPPPPCRVSQVPRLFYSCALSPTTPEGPAGACSLLPHRYQASSSLADWPPSLCVTRPNRVRLRYGSQVCFPGFHQTDCSTSLRFSYMHERAIYMVKSFQFTRSARLSLVHQRRKENKERSSLRLCAFAR